jgi:hypothetical protein
MRTRAAATIFVVDFPANRGIPYQRSLGRFALVRPKKALDPVNKISAAQNEACGSAPLAEFSQPSPFVSLGAVVSRFSL